MRITSVPPAEAIARLLRAIACSCSAAAASAARNAYRWPQLAVPARPSSAAEAFHGAHACWIAGCCEPTPASGKVEAARVAPFCMWCRPARLVQAQARAPEPSPSGVEMNDRDSGPAATPRTIDMGSAARVELTYCRSAMVGGSRSAAVLVGRPPYARRPVRRKLVGGHARGHRARILPRRRVALFRSRRPPRHRRDACAVRRRCCRDR